MIRSNAQEYLSENFEILKELHATEKNTIFLALNKNDQLIYIIKQSKLKGIPYKELQSINNQILPKIFFVTESDEHTTIVEEYIHGQTLQEFLNANGNLSEALCIDLLKQLCCGLAEIHKHRIIHRDIKPSNIMLTATKTIKLIDFDASRITKNEQTYDTQYLGTRGYAAPEQYGFGQTDIRTDIYAIGATFKELLGNEYHGRLLAVLDKCTALNPGNRYQTVGELMFAVEHQPNKYKVPILCLCIITAISLFIYKTYDSRPPQSPPAIEQDPAATGIDTQKPAATQTDKPKPANKEESQKPLDKVMPPAPASTPQAADSQAGGTEPIVPLNPALKEERVQYGQIALTIHYSGSGEFYADYRSERYKLVFPTATNWRKAPVKSDYPSYYFPANEYLIFNVTNKSDYPLINPVFHLRGRILYPKGFFSDAVGSISFDMEDMANPGFNHFFRWRKIKTIPPGESHRFQIPLSQAILMNVGGEDELRLHTEISIDNGDRIDRSMDIFFKDIHTSN